MDNSVFAITIDDEDALATAFVISQGNGWTRLITCSHAIPKGTTVVKVDREEATLVFRNEDLDLAVLSVSAILGVPVKFAVTAPRSTARLLGVSADGLELRKEPIDVTNVTFVSTAKDKRKEFVEHFRFEHKREISKGYSGSPVYDSESHLVFAMLCRGQAAVDSAKGYCLSFKAIQKELSPKLIDGMDVGSMPSAEAIRAPLTDAQVTPQVLVPVCPTKTLLENELAESLHAFDGQPIVWIPPTIRRSNELQSPFGTPEKDIKIQDIIASDDDITILGRQQYGLTSLGRHLCVAALSERDQFWIFADLKLITPYDNAIEKWLLKLLKTVKKEISEIDAFVFDHYDNTDEKAMAVASKLQKKAPDARVICLVGSDSVVTSSLRIVRISEGRAHSAFHLWALKKNSVRKIVENYNVSEFIGNSNAVVDTVVRDLSALNIPRTPINCLMLLKIYEKSFDDNPVNRTELLHRFLFLIFNVKGLPDYKTQPNVKDAEFLLGWLCEGMVRSGEYVFERADFIKKTESFCAEQQIDIDVGLIFDALFSNRIIEGVGSRFRFRFSSWIAYFLSHRMHFDDVFRELMISSVSNSMYPEIMEFYAGIDRKRLDAVEKMTDVIRNIREDVENSFGLPENFNPYTDLRWDLSDKAADDLCKSLSDDVQVSKLPAEIKDRYSDRSYDPSRSYSQGVHTVLSEYSVVSLQRAISAGSRVLRNSDFVGSDKRHALMKEILLAWREMVDVLLSIAPALIQDGSARIGGVNFVLVNESEKEVSFDESLLRCIVILPMNVVMWSCDDLFSPKMSPLLMQHLKEGENRDDLATHMLHSFVIQRRPKGWVKAIEQYVGKIGNDTFFLMDTLNMLMQERDYGNFSPKVEADICRLATTTIAMHKEGVKKPSKKALSRVTLRAKK